jgi:cytochrome c oxidase subunit 2
MVEVPVDTPVTFRITSPDIVHGVHVPFTNMSTMVIPGYVSEVTTAFPREGEATFFCNEYCGLGHDYRWSKLKVVSKG